MTTYLKIVSQLFGLICLATIFAAPHYINKQQQNKNKQNHPTNHKPKRINQ